MSGYADIHGPSTVNVTLASGLGAYLMRVQELGAVEGAEGSLAVNPVLEGIVRRAMVPIASTAMEMVQSYAGDPRTIITLVMKSISKRLTEPRTIAIPKLMMREMINFPDFAKMYREEVLDRVIPMITGLLRTGIAEGYLRRVDPELTIRSIIGPIMLHVLLDEVFNIRPDDGLSLDRLIDNHLTILFDGLSAPHSDKRFMAT